MKLSIRNLLSISLITICLMFSTGCLFIEGDWNYWTKYTVSLFSENSSEYEIYLPLILIDNNISKTSERIGKVKEWEIIDTLFGPAFSIRTNKDVQINLNFDYYDPLETLSLQNETNSPPEFIGGDEEKYRTIWIYYHGLKINDTITLNLHFEHGYKGMHREGYHDGLWRIYGINAEVANGWNLVELEITWNGIG